MPYHAYKEGSGFRIVHESWSNGARIRRSVPRAEWGRLGFDRAADVGHARELARTLNRVEREERLRNRALRRIAEDEADAYIFLPPATVAKFEGDIAPRFKPAHWKAAKRAIRAVGIPPKDWYRRAFLFYDWFASKRYSPDYSKSVLRLANEYGYYYAEEHGGFFRPVPFPRGPAIRKIRRAYFTKGRGPSRRLMPEELTAVASEFTDEELRWLELTVAFGLRPEEADQGREGVIAAGAALRIFQPKMERLGERPARCWKTIPARTPFQARVLESAAQPRRRPSRLKLRRVFGKGLTYYAGRRGFTVYMQRAQGCSPYEVSKWLGHKGLDTMRKHYDEED